MRAGQAVTGPGFADVESAFLPLPGGPGLMARMLSKPVRRVEPKAAKFLPKFRVITRKSLQYFIPAHDVPGTM